MLLNIIKNSFINQKKSMVLMISSVAVGTALAASLITLSYEISGKVSRELRSFGANIIVEPEITGIADLSGQKRYLREEDIVKVKTIFWRHNILGISPFLESEATIFNGDVMKDVKLMGAWYRKELPLPGEKKTFTAGIVSVSPSWELKGRWPGADDEIVLGSTLASELGVTPEQQVRIDNSSFRVTGILDTGGPEDMQVFMQLESLQRFRGLKGLISRAFVSALTKPMDDFAYKDPEQMTQSEYEKWYCTGYVTSIARQVEEVFRGSSARPIWRIAESEGKLLGKLEILTYLICIITLIASALSVSTTMIMSLLRRTEEIGLMKALGATRNSIMAIFMAESAFIGLFGGILGYLASLAVSTYIGRYVFDTSLQQKDFLLLIAISSAIMISIAGTVMPVKSAIRIKPAVVLKEAK
jgi:putative ABC transport system permease protein